MNLKSAGVLVTEYGVKADAHCRTTAKHIFAAGDVTGRLQFTHMGEHTAKVAVTNALLRTRQKVDERHLVWCTYTDPELAHVGAGEEELQKADVKYEVYRFPYSKLDRAVTERESTGLVKVFAKPSNGRIYGVSILGAHAGEMIAEFALAMKRGLTLGHIANTIHAYPTYALGNRRVADQWYLRKRTRFRIRLLQAIFGYRGVYADLSDGV